MPYIDQKMRKALQAGSPPGTPGELNYVTTYNILQYLERAGTSYETLNALIGVLECAKLELYRRVIAGYEDQKCEERGDVYPEGGDR